MAVYQTKCKTEWKRFEEDFTWTDNQKEHVFKTVKRMIQKEHVFEIVKRMIKTTLQIIGDLCKFV